MAVATGGLVFGDEGNEIKLEDIQLNDFGRVILNCLYTFYQAMT